MDMEKDKDRFLLQLADDLSFEELQDLCYSKDANQFYSARLADWFVDKINYGWRLWQAAKAQASSNLHYEILVKSIIEHVDSHLEANHLEADLFDKGWNAAMRCVRNNIAMLEAEEPTND